MDEKLFETAAFYDEDAHIKWIGPLRDIPYELRTPYTYFQLCMPNNLYSEWVDATNQKLVQSASLTNVGELIKFCGIQLAMSVDLNRGSCADFWSTTIEKDSVTVPRCYGQRFGMNRNRFMQIKQYFSLRVPQNISEDRESYDEFYLVRNLITKFNDNMMRILKCGRRLTVDEIMMAWEGMTSKYAAEGCPGVTKITRKPKGIGIELKATGDSETRLIVWLEIREGAAAVHKKEYYHQYGASTAVTLRATKIGSVREG